VAGQDIAGMAPRAIVFTLANHDPEVEPPAAGCQHHLREPPVAGSSACARW